MFLEECQSVRVRGAQGGKASLTQFNQGLGEDVRLEELVRKHIVRQAPTISIRKSGTRILEELPAPRIIAVLQIKINHYASNKYK